MFDIASFALGLIGGFLVLTAIELLAANYYLSRYRRGGDGE